MKRVFVLYILCWVLGASSASAVSLQPLPLTFANAATSSTPLLDKIVSAASAPTIKTVSSAAGTLAMPIINTIIAAAEGNTPAVVGNILTIPVYVYGTTVAGAAATLAVGYLTNAEFDLKNAYDNGWLQNYPALAEILGQKYPVTVPPDLDGTNIACSDTYLSYCAGGNVAHLTLHYTQPNELGGMSQSALQDWINTYPQYMSGWTSANIYWVRTNMHLGTNGLWYLDRITYNVTYISGVPAQYGPPQTLPSSDVPDLAQRIANGIASNPAVKTALNNLAQAHPEVIPTPQPINQTDINNWATTNNYNTNQTYIDNLTNLANTYPENVDVKIALEQAKAQQEKEEAEKAAETYEPLTPSGFDPAYNPGEFDIPARFTTFIDNVKSSPLFSFSDSFFNSLPGGGSPIYEIEAGQYGHHTVDLSQTMSGGLAVLKVILLVIFGFVSIRTVILKR